MNPLKQTGFADRLSAANEAKKAQLAKFKPKPAVQAESLVTRAEERAAELEAVRRARAEAKEAARQEALAREQAAADAVRKARKERKALSEAEAKAKRDARYAARKARRS